MEALTQCEAVRLFIDRAGKARPNFTVTNENAPHVSEVCHRLDGIPLAIELAAARTRVLTISQIAQGLADRFVLLTGGARTALPRQRTLEASVDWSYSVLEPSEKKLLNRLSVFAGGFTLDAAEAVCGGDDIERIQVLDLVSQLVDKSLVQMDEVHGGVSFFEQAATASEAAGDPWFLGQSQIGHGFMLMQGGILPEARKQMRKANANARANGDYLNTRESLTWLSWIETFLENFQEAERLSDEALRIMQDMKDDFFKAYLLVPTAWRKSHEGEYEASRSLFQESIELARKTSNLLLIPLAQTWLGNVEVQLGNLEEETWISNGRSPSRCSLSRAKLRCEET